MQYQICECGEQIPPNELGTKLLTHWQHQHQTCLYSYIGCVSVSILKSTVYVYGQTSLKLDLKVKKGLPREYRRCFRLSSKLARVTPGCTQTHVEWPLLLENLRASDEVHADELTCEPYLIGGRIDR